MDMVTQRIVMGSVEIPKKGGRQFQPTIKESKLDEWRALGYDKAQIVYDGLNVVIEPIEKEAPCAT